MQADFAGCRPGFAQGLRPDTPNFTPKSARNPHQRSTSVRDEFCEISGLTDKCLILELKAVGQLTGAAIVP